MSGAVAVGRRELLTASALAPLLSLLARGEASAAEYASAADALDALDRLEVDVSVRLSAIAAALPAARAFVASVLADQRVHAAERSEVRRRLRVPESAPPAAPASAERDLASLRAAQEALVYAHAEGLPALGDPQAVHVLARHLVATARHLTVIDLWIEAEDRRGG